MSANGKLTAAELATIPGTSQQIRADLVHQVAAFRAAFERKFGKPLRVTDGYRPYWLQEKIFRERYTRFPLIGRPTKRWLDATWWQRPWTAMASVPGKSNHGWGTALDLGSGVNSRYTDEHAWAVANAPTYGFIWPSWWARGAGEWWHFEGGTVLANFPSVSPVIIGTPAPPPIVPLEDDVTPDNLIEIRGIVRDELLKVLRAPEFELQKSKRLTVADIWAFVTGSGASADVALGAAAKESKLAADRATQIRNALTVETAPKSGVFVARKVTVDAPTPPPIVP